jgi:hypothetical protein
MRRILFTVLASGLLCVAGTSTALARHHARSHHHHRSHARIKHERFGSDPQAPATNAAAAPSAGTVVSFTNHVLTIKLADNSTVSGTVTSATEVDCESAAGAQMQNDDGGGSGSGENSGSTSGDNSGDQGDDNAEQGDDNAEQGDDQGVSAAACATALGTAGTVVQEAELSVTGAGATWSKVELATP